MPAALAGDHAQVWVGGYELTADTQRITIADLRDLHDATAFGDMAHKFIPGQQLTRVDHMGYLDAWAARSHEVLRGNAVEGLVSVALGQNAAAVLGDPTYSFHTRQNTYRTLPQIGQVVPFTARYTLGGDLVGRWGQALAVGATFSSTASGAALNQGSASVLGGVAVLHILQAGADIYTLTVEGATDAAFTTGLVTLATFPLNGTAVGSARVNIGGSIPQYVRWKAVRTSGSANNIVRITVNLIRN